jgi:hypothetical protein
MGYFLIFIFGIGFAHLDVIIVRTGEKLYGGAWRKSGMNASEKRKFKRLSLKLDLSCHRVDSPSEILHAGRTVNVGPGGIYFETSAKIFEPGHLIKIDMAIPPTNGLLQFGGRVSGFAKVLRTHRVADDAVEDVTQGFHGVAVEFCHPPRLSV